ncbi:hypothetical protein MLD38_028439 [Melastoma candidum]|uniref:Uncharacterized protein n=1 Tax=Melastoma candidum TaxID=119954 RepID=A0ACB9N107_9MYRT|nr:hypothetical protein MLD38_028439 [Melastoma candidum]
MGSRIWVILFALLWLADIGEQGLLLHNAISSSCKMAGECVGAKMKMAMDSDIRRGLLGAGAGKNTRHISYDALKKDEVPCNRKGQSYYNCTKMKNANPYKRGCSVITHCKRYTG